MPRWTHAIVLFSLLMLPVAPAAQEEVFMPLAAIPHHQPSGSRFVPGVGSMPDAVYLSVQLDGVPKWVVGTPSRSRASWLVALEDGRVLAVDANGRLTTAGQLAPGQPPVGMIDPDGDLALLPLPADASVRSVPVVLPDGLLYVAKNGDVVRISRGSIAARRALDALPDARIVVRGERAAVYAGQTARYAHGVLGDAVEASALVVFDVATLDEAYRITLDGGMVFEGLTPLWTDLDGGGSEELIATVADAELGARIRVYAGDTGEQVAEGPLIGRGGRWRHQLAAGAFSEDGVIELASVLTPEVETAMLRHTPLGRLGEAAELADVEVDPAHLVLGRALGDQHHLGLDDPGVADQRPAGLDDGLRYGVAEMFAQRAEDGPPVGFELGRLAHVLGREAAAEVDHREIDAALGAGAKDGRG